MQVSEVVDAKGIQKSLLLIFTVNIIFRNLHPRVALWGLLRVSKFQHKTVFLCRYNYDSLEDQTEFRLGGDICGKEKAHMFRSRTGKIFKVTFKLTN